MTALPPAVITVDASPCLTCGKPNFAERAFVKKAVKAGEPFPVRKVQLKFPPQRRAA